MFSFIDSHANINYCEYSHNCIHVSHALSFSGLIDIASSNSFKSTPDKVAVGDNQRHHVNMKYVFWFFYKRTSINDTCGSKHIIGLRKQTTSASDISVSCCYVAINKKTWRKPSFYFSKKARLSVLNDSPVPPMNCNKDWKLTHECFCLHIVFVLVHGRQEKSACIVWW